MKLDITYLKLLFLKPQEMKTNFILMTEKALKIWTDSKIKSNDGVLTTSTALGWFGQESLAHIFQDLFCSISCFPQTCHDVQLVSSEWNILHPERRFYTLSWKHLQKAAMHTLSIQVLIVFFCVRVYLDAEVMSLRGFWHQQKGETTNITSPNSSRSLCFFCPVSVSTWMLSSRLLGNESCATASEAASGVWSSIRPTKNSRRGLGHGTAVLPHEVE